MWRAASSSFTLRPNIIETMRLRKKRAFSMASPHDIVSPAKVDLQAL